MLSSPTTASFEGLPFPVVDGYDFSSLRVVGFAWRGSSKELLYNSTNTVLEISGGSWMAVELPSKVRLGPYSSLSFCYESNSARGRTHGIGLTNDPSSTSFGGWFDVMGTNAAWAKSIGDYRYRPVRGWQCMDAALAEYYALGSTASHLTFVNQLDDSPYLGRWTGVRILDNDDCAACLDFSANRTDQEHSLIRQSGCSLELRDSTTKTVALLRPFEVTLDTRLTFCYAQQYSCGLHAISPLTNATGPVFAIDGHDVVDHIRDFRYSASYFESQCFDVPLADYLSAGDSITAIAFINACDEDLPFGALWSKVAIITT